MRVGARLNVRVRLKLTGRVVRARRVKASPKCVLQDLTCT